MDTADLLVGLFAAGMGLSFFGTDPKSPTSRALAVFLVALGVTFCLNLPVSAGLLGRDPWLWGRLFTLGETTIFVAAYEWLLRIRRTEATADRQRYAATRDCFASRRVSPVSTGCSVSYSTT